MHARMCFARATAGGMLWSPLLCALMFVVLSPSKSGLEAEKEEAVRAAVEKASVTNC